MPRVIAPVALLLTVRLCVWTAVVEPENVSK